MKEPKDMTKEDWQQLEIEAEEIMKEVEEHREELDKMMEELPPDFFDKMHDELMQKIREHEKSHQL